MTKKQQSFTDDFREQALLLLHTSRAIFAEFLMTPTKVLDTPARIA
jgi:hypothetical protein